MKPWRWMLRVLKTELSVVFAYRLDFWLNFIGRTAALFATSYFLWSSIFAARGVETIGQYSFPEMMLYSLLAPLLNRVSVGGEFVGMQRDIYEGTLNRYLLFPIPYGVYKWIGFTAQSLLAVLQCLGLIALVSWVMGESFTTHFQWGHLMMALIAAFAANILYFLVASSLEMIAFWQDNVWSLIIMLRFLIFFLGGMAVPLDLYPESMRVWLELTPFPYFVGIPMQIALGHGQPDQWFKQVLVLGLWILVLWVVFRLIWNLGKHKYSGVGI